MSNLSIGGYTVVNNPVTMTVIKPEKPCAGMKTYTSAVYLAWSATYIGKTIEMSWPVMDVVEFNTLDALYVADNEIEFNPQDGSGYIFNGYLVGVQGSYFMGNDLTTATKRKDVVIAFLITEIVSFTGSASASPST